MSSFSPPAQSWWTRGQHPGHNSLSGLRPSAPSKFPSPDFWTPAQTPLYSQFLQHRNGLRAGRISWKEGSKWERRRRRLRTCDGLRPLPSTTPTLWNIPGTDLQGSRTISFPPPSFLGCRTARPQGNRELVLRREQRPGQEGLLHTSALGHVRAT